MKESIYQLDHWEFWLMKKQQQQQTEEMLCSQVQLLVVVLVPVLLVRVSAAPRTGVLTDVLRAELSKDKVSP